MTSLTKPGFEPNCLILKYTLLPTVQPFTIFSIPWSFLSTIFSDSYYALTIRQVLTRSKIEHSQKKAWRLTPRGVLDLHCHLKERIYSNTAKLKLNLKKKLEKTVDLDSAQWNKRKARGMKPTTVLFAIFAQSFSNKTERLASWR